MENNNKFEETSRASESPSQNYTRGYYANSPAPVYTVDATAKQEKKRYGIGVIFICIVLSLMCGFGGAFAALSLNNMNRDVVINSVDKGDELAGELNSSLSSVVDATKDSVVEITTEIVSMSSFVGQYVTEGAGSGVILSSTGNTTYILTNNHIVEGTNSLTVTTTSGAKYQATVVGTDSRTDIAVISIEASGLTAAKVGNSDELKVGDAIIAIGNPLGSLGGTVTEGIISALDREITINSQPMNLLQISAAVNPGNSGGGLFNAFGELVGIVNSKSTSSSSSSPIEGLGFAVPINTAVEVATSIIDSGYVTGRPVFGITVIDISSEQAAYQYGVTRLGVYVNSVTKGMGADKAGVAEGDYLVSIDSVAVSSSAEVIKILNGHTVGDTVELQIIRDNKILTLSVELMENIPTK